MADTLTTTRTAYRGLYHTPQGGPEVGPCTE